MNVAVKEEELQQFVREQVSMGSFDSAEDLVACALTHFKANIANTEKLSPETIKAIMKSDQQILRGEYMTSEQLRARLEAEVFKR